MARKEKKYHFIYKTTNILSGKYYIGMHSTDNLNDGYLGSGNRLRLAVRKHGKENFKREILEYCETRDELKKREKEIVSLNEIAKIDCMNLVVGGGGFMLDDYHYECAKNGNKKLNLLLKNNLDFREMWLSNVRIGVQKAMDDGKMKTWKDNYDWTGKKHSEEAKLKISQGMKNKGIGENNSQYNTCWVCNKNTIKKIKKEELGVYLNEGWVKGKFYNINEIVEYYEDVNSYGKTAKYFNIPKRTIIDNIKNYKLII